MNRDKLIKRLQWLRDELKREDLRPQDRSLKEQELRSIARKLNGDKQRNYHMWE